MSKDSRRRTLEILDAMSEEREASWAKLVEQSDSKLRVLLHFLLRDARGNADPEDIRQETWGAAVRNFARFEYRGAGSFYAWLAAIARHKVQQAGRRRSSTALIGNVAKRGSKYSAPPPELLDAIESTQTSVGSRVANRELIKVVKRIVGELPDELREVILRRIYEGRSGREVAKLQGVHESTVSVRLKKALDHCSRMLAKQS